MPLYLDVHRHMCCDSATIKFFASTKFHLDTRAYSCFSPAHCHRFCHWGPVPNHRLRSDTPLSHQHASEPPKHVAYNITASKKRLSQTQCSQHLPSHESQQACSKLRKNTVKPCPSNKTSTRKLRFPTISVTHFMDTLWRRLGDLLVAV
jgi:hypothetical protein